MSNEPILIVGAGPVGLTAAVLLARQGVDIRVIDSNEGPTDRSKALVLWRRSLQVLDPAIPFERFLDGFEEARSVRLSSEGRLLADIDLTENDRVLPPGVFVPQSDTERILLEGLASFGVEVERRTKLESCSSADGQVIATLEGPRGSETMKTTWLVACDGGHSTVRHSLQLDFGGDTVNRRWLLADVRIEENEVPNTMFIEGTSEGTVALFPVGPGRWRVIADGGEVDPDREAKPLDLAMVQEIIDRRTQRGWTLREGLWLTEFHVNERQVDNYVHGRMVLAGDAAHVHSPAGGQGMNTGIQDAANLAWKLAAIIRGEAPESLMQTYQEERHPVGAAVVRGSSLMLKAAMHSGPLARGLRSFVVPAAMSIGPLRRKFIDFIVEDAVTYRRGPLGGTRREGAQQGPGDAFPDVAIDVNGDGDGDTRPATDLLRHGGPTLLLLGEQETPEHLSFGGGQHSQPVLIQTLSAKTQRGLASQLGLPDGGLVLVRPDSVIAAIDTNISGIHIWLDMNLGGH